MIYSLHGTLLRKEPGFVVVECAGVGYGARVSSQTFPDLPMPGQPVKLLTYLAVSETDMTLYGFSSDREREVFRRLLNVSQIGPAKALGVLSSAPIDDLLAAIELQDYKRLQGYKGLGPKLAQRLVVELRDKMADLSGIDPKAPGRPEFAAAGAFGSAGLTTASSAAMAHIPVELRDAVQAIEALFGVPTPDALQYVRQAQQSLPKSAKTPDLVKAATQAARGG
ncbi:MAG TPA: Holliday junction branch migration protein RuvA [Planctomycetota bacterium]|nr:Holliday junction branch migration protein RuvA [Planctomycetota bacterium]